MIGVQLRCEFQQDTSSTSCLNKFHVTFCVVQLYSFVPSPSSLLLSGCGLCYLFPKHQSSKNVLHSVLACFPPFSPLFIFFSVSLAVTHFDLFSANSCKGSRTKQAKVTSLSHLKTKRTERLISRERQSCASTHLSPSYVHAPSLLVPHVPLVPCAFPCRCFFVSMNMKYFMSSRLLCVLPVWGFNEP